MAASKKDPVDEDLYRLIVEQTRDYAVFVLDPTGHIRTWNLGAANIKGYAADEIIGKHFSTFYTRDSVDSGWPDYELKVATAEGRFEDEGWRVRKDGSRFWANVVITALRDDNGKLLGFSKITRDLSERKSHEEALRQSEERFRILIEGVLDYAIFMLDPEGIVTSWNSGAQHIKGYTPGEIIGKHFSRFYPEEDIAAGRPWEELATARRTGRSENEGWRVRKDGKRFWARSILSALRDPDGRLRGYAKVTQDLSDRRHIQDLEKAAQNVNEFIAMLAHELRNPLAPIRNAVQVMAKAPAGAPAHAAMRDTIDRQSAQLTRIVDDMLDITRMTRGELVVERASIDLKEVVMLAIETVSPAMNAAGHRFDLEMSGDPMPVQGDLHRLTQLLTNVLNNAVRYTPPGGQVTLQAGTDQGKAFVRVRDNGRGIEAGLIDRIFDMFVQGRTPLERVGGGLGIGLGLARKIAEMHGGVLEARSEGTDKGAEFTLWLPLSKPARAATARRSRYRRDAADARAPQRVLVVDDNHDAAAALELLVKSLGHETCVVFDGAEALEKAGEFRPDIVFLDIGMPGLDGYEVARQLRALQTGPLRIIAVTGWGQDADKRRSHEAGFDLHLVKPVDVVDLAKALSGRGSATLH